MNSYNSTDNLFELYSEYITALYHTMIDRVEQEVTYDVAFVCCVLYSTWGLQTASPYGWACYIVSNFLYSTWGLQTMASPYDCAWYIVSNFNNLVVECSRFQGVQLNLVNATILWQRVWTRFDLDFHAEASGTREPLLSSSREYRLPICDVLYSVFKPARNIV